MLSLKLPPPTLLRSKGLMAEDDLNALGKSRRILEASRLKLAAALANEMTPRERHEVIEQLLKTNQALKVIVEMLNKAGR